jgi:hypothetical protein
MTVATGVTYGIHLVGEVVPAGGGLRILFRDGSSAFLEATHPHFAVCRINAESRRGRSLPVGVVLDAEGRVVDLNAAHDTPVRHVREFARDRNRLEVAFWAYNPICALIRDHPDFARIHATLAGAAGKPQILWVATHSEETVEGQPDEDGLVPAYPKIMDVRPA